MNIIIKLRKGASIADKGRINANIKELAKCYPEIIESVECETLKE